ncbi:MAG: tRNA 2-thiouridine(34) synthase MnmA [Arenicellales bacterium]
MSLWKKDHGRRVIVGMSGGVDSAVAAAQLLEADYEVVGLFMKNWEEDDDAKYCAAEVDLADAKSVCSLLGIHLETANFSHEYWENVFVHFLREYKVGRTPNPDILCNSEIKFKTFMERAMALGADFIATGHYAQKSIYENRLSLKKGADPEKDQTYFLHTIGQQELMKSLFPVGHMHKSQVRERANEIGFTVKDKKDSTGICFIGERRFKDFLNQYLPVKAGEIKTLNGQTIGTHRGAMFYTIGQRNGLGIGGMDKSDDTGEPWFVASKDVEKNVLYVVQGHDHPALHKQIVITEAVSWVSACSPVLPLECKAKTRYRQIDQACTIVAYSNNQARVHFKSSQRAIAPGQSLVFYSGEHCLGGGVIQQGLNAK